MPTAHCPAEGRAASERAWGLVRMGFLSKLFRSRKYRESGAEDWENIVYDRDGVNFREEEQRTRYIVNCLEQIQEATKEMQLLTGEYRLVTSYLTDMDEIAALPASEREKLNVIAGQCAALEQERRRYQGKKDRMANSVYGQLREHEEDIQEGIAKLRECENYGAKVKKDLQRLDRERNAYEFRKQELDANMNNLRGMTLIFLTAFVICLLMLVVLHFGFKMDTRLGYLLAVAAVAVAVTVAWMKYTDGEGELHRVEVAVNKLIQLQNKVKIRYVNNKNLTDYLCIKYSADSADKLEKLWVQYQTEKDERREYAEAEAKMEYYRRQLVQKMTNYRIICPGRWLSRPESLLDKGEMVEMRHELILRRQALRKQMDYNNNVAETARKEIRDITDRYPAYAEEIRRMTEQYGMEDIDGRA